MGLRFIKIQLRDTVLAKSHGPTFDDARTREPVLADHASILSVLAVLADASDATYPERDALTRALVAEQQRAPSPLWTSALMLAYAPMLTRLRGRLMSSAVDRDELDLLVVEAFLEAAQAYPLQQRRPGHTALYLRQDTQRAVFKLLKLEHRRAEVTGELGDEDEIVPLGEVIASERDPETEAREVDEMAAILRARAGGTVPAERLDLVERTYLRGESLRDVVVAANPGVTGDALDAVYQRTKRQRARAGERLRDVFPEGREPPLPAQSAW
ncbi:MAG: hypothetical protein IT374_03215 [Polyangiaceae bacterium]|nr:hypothetical protein [Polyangiaceae bacterium]